MSVIQFPGNRTVAVEAAAPVTTRKSPKQGAHADLEQLIETLQRAKNAAHEAEWELINAVAGTAEWFDGDVSREHDGTLRVSWSYWDRRRCTDRPCSDMCYLDRCGNIVSPDDDCSIPF